MILLKPNDGVDKQDLDTRDTCGSCLLVSIKTLSSERKPAIIIEANLFRITSIFIMSNLDRHKAFLFEQKAICQRESFTEEISLSATPFLWK